MHPRAFDRSNGAPVNERTTGIGIVYDRSFIRSAARCAGESWHSGSGPQASGPQYSLAVAGVLAEWLESSYVVSLPSIRVVTTGALQRVGAACPGGPGPPYPRGSSLPSCIAGQERRRFVSSLKHFGDRFLCHSYPTQFPRDFRTLSSLDEQLVTNRTHGGRALGEICSMLGRVFYHKSSINQTYSIIVAEVSEDPLGVHVYELVTKVFVTVSTGPLSVPAN